MPATAAKDLTGPHSAFWRNSAILWNRLEMAMNELRYSIPPGRCNFYRFPCFEVQMGEHRYEITLSSVQVGTLVRLVMRLVHEPIMFEADAHGSYIVNALLSANNARSIKLALALISQNPTLATLSHGQGIRAGENCLHVLAGNGQDCALRSLLSLMAEHLDEEQLSKLLRGKVHGSFFTSAKLDRQFGATPVAFMAAQSCRKSLEFVLNNEKLSCHVNLNGDPCATTGFLPIHATIASGNANMFDYLTSRKLPVSQRADPDAMTQPSPGSILPLPLTPMQLAVRLGSQRMFFHIFKRRCKVLYKWGPTSAYALELTGIDSASSTGGVDVIALICADDARTQVPLA